MLLLVLADLSLLLASFASAYVALGWGEIGGFPIHGDKSALGGLLAVLIFMVVRWCALCFPLGVAVSRDGFATLLPAGRGLQLLIVLGLHLFVGAISYLAFSWISTSLQHDDPDPRKLSWVIGLLLPLPAFLAAFWGLHRSWIPRHPVLTLVLLALLGWAHVAGYRSGWTARAAASAPVPPPR